MKTFKLFLLAPLLVQLAAGAATPAAQPVQFSKDYWQRGFASGVAYAFNCNVNIKVESQTSAEQQVTQLLLKNKATLSQNYRNGSDKHATRIMGFVISNEVAEAVCRDVLTFGTIQNYNFSPQYDSKQLVDIEERLRYIANEREANFAALEHMPVSKALLDATVERLQAGKKALREGADKTYISITLTPRD